MVELTFCFFVELKTRFLRLEEGSISGEATFGDFELICGRFKAICCTGLDFWTVSTAKSDKFAFSLFHLSISVEILSSGGFFLRLDPFGFRKVPFFVVL